MFTSCCFVLIYPISLVISIVDVKMVSTRKEKQQNNQDEQIESRDNIICRSTSSDNVSNPTQLNYPQVDVHTLEKNTVSKVRSEVDNVLTSVETRIQDALLTAVEFLVIPRVELVMKPTNAPSKQSVDGNLLERDQRDF